MVVRTVVGSTVVMLAILSGCGLFLDFDPRRGGSPTDAATNGDGSISTEVSVGDAARDASTTDVVGGDAAPDSVMRDANVDALVRDSATDGTSDGAREANVDAVAPDAHAPDATAPDSGVTDANVDANGRDGSASDAGSFDAGWLDVVIYESGSPDAPSPYDGGVRDVGPADAGSPDVGAPDTGVVPDTGISLDTGVDTAVDAGIESGSPIVDSGSFDSGVDAAVESGVDSAWPQMDAGFDAGAPFDDGGAIVPDVSVLVDSGPTVYPPVSACLFMDTTVVYSVPWSEFIDPWSAIAVNDVGEVAVAILHRANPNYNAMFATYDAATFAQILPPTTATIGAATNHRREMALVPAGDNFILSLIIQNPDYRPWIQVWDGTTAPTPVMVPGIAALSSAGMFEPALGRRDSDGLTVLLWKGGYNPLGITAGANQQMLTASRVVIDETDTVIPAAASWTHTSLGTARAGTFPVPRDSTPAVAVGPTHAFALWWDIDQLHYAWIELATNTVVQGATTIELASSSLPYYNGQVVWDPHTNQFVATWKIQVSSVDYTRLAFFSPDGSVDAPRILPVRGTGSVTRARPSLAVQRDAPRYFMSWTVGVGIFTASGSELWSDPFLSTGQTRVAFDEYSRSLFVLHHDELSSVEFRAHLRRYACY